MVQMGFDQKRCERAWNTFGNEEEAVAWLLDGVDDAPVAKVSTKRKPKQAIKRGRK